MFTSNIKIRGGMDKWMSGLAGMIRRKRRPLRKGEPEAVTRPDPETEGQRALYQAMGWKDNAWEE